MRMPYRFNEKTDPKNQVYGMNATELLANVTRYRKQRYGYFSQARSLEDQIEVLVGAIGGLAEVLISKGRMSPQEFIEAIDCDDDYEVRENNLNG